MRARQSAHLSLFPAYKNLSYSFSCLVILVFVSHQTSKYFFLFLFIFQLNGLVQMLVVETSVIGPLVFSLILFSLCSVFTFAFFVQMWLGTISVVSKKDRNWLNSDDLKWRQTYLAALHFARPTLTPETQIRKLQHQVCVPTLKTNPKKRKDTTLECYECNVGVFSRLWNLSY